MEGRVYRGCGNFFGRVQLFGVLQVCKNFGGRVHFYPPSSPLTPLCASMIRAKKSNLINLDTFDLMIVLAANKLFMRSKVNNNAIFIFLDFQFHDGPCD